MFRFGKKREQEAPAEQSVQGATNLFERILLVVDASEASSAAAQFAVRLALQTGGRLLAVHVVDTATMDYLMQMHIFVREEREEFEKDMERTGRRYLEYVSAIARKNGLDVETHLHKGSFHRTILDVARDENASVIVLGGWRHTITRKDVTSVERQLILDEAICPVIVVKAESAS